MQAQPLISSPFGILTAVVAPAVLTNACSILALGTANRVARVVDRTRAVTAEMGATGEDRKLYAMLDAQLTILRRRAQLLVKALRFAYLALGGFASSALVALIGGALSHLEVVAAYRIVSVLGLLIGLVSVAGLVSACAMMVRETTMAIDNLAEEAHIYSIVRQKHDHPSQ